MSSVNSKATPKAKRRSQPFRRAVLRGLGVVMPPLLTIVIFLWVGNTVHLYVLDPVSTGTRNVLAWYLSEQDPGQVEPSAEDGDQPAKSVQLPGGAWIDAGVRKIVAESDPAGVLATGDVRAVYRRYVELEYLRPSRVIPVVLCVFILVLYLLGKFLAAGIGRFFLVLFERGIFRLPLVRNVYGAVKQVTDFMLNEREMEYTRAVAVEYPRKGIWSLGFVTGESLPDLRAAANEPVLALMIPSSPMPLTGVTITVPKSETIELNMTLDQAFQFVISCGVVVPPTQIRSAIEAVESPS